MKKTLALFLLVAGGCAGQVGVDGAADEAALSGGAKTDAAGAAAIDGIYQLDGDPTGVGDVLYLWLLADGRFAWTRCYDVDCATPVVEDGTYALSTSSGKKYITFRQPDGSDGHARFHSMYAYSIASGALKLRAVRTSHWMTLTAVAESDQCAASGGTWSDAGRCDCGGRWPLAYSPGAGGCWVSPAVSENNCDATHGSWTDDDPALPGTFCICGYGRHLTDDGCFDNAF